MLQAIEITYRGYRLRSHLEKRWAVFFDVLGVEWNYEINGLVLSDGTWYIPDFWMPQVRMWAEVKPDVFTKEEIRKIKLLAMDSKQPVLKLLGPPDFKNFDAYQVDPWCDELMEYDYSLVPWFLKEGYFPCVNFCPPGYDESYGSLYWQAVQAARAVRYEFGEE